MKKIMKKTLSFVLALVMVLALAPMTAKAAPAALPAGTGTGDDPYVVTTDGTTYMVLLEANGIAFVSTGDVYDATIDGVASTTGEYSFKRGKTDYSPVESVDGIATITLEGSNMVMVCNLAEEENAVYLQATSGAGAGAPVGTMDDPEVVTMTENEYTGTLGANLSAELAAGSQGYYYRYTAEEAGAVIVGVDCADADWNPVGWMYYVNNSTAGKYGDMHFSDDEEVVYTEIVPVAAGDVIDVFVSTYNPEDMWNNPAGIAYVNFGFATTGSADYPEEAVAGEYNTTIKEGAGEYFYMYTATEDGKLTVTMGDNNAAGWSYSLFNYNTWAMTDYHTSADDPVVMSDGLFVSAGDEVEIAIGTCNPDEPWSLPAGEVAWTLSLEAGATGDEGGDGNEDIGGGSEDDGVVSYIEHTTEITPDVEMYVLDKWYDYNVFVFAPAEPGKYTISSGNSTIGIVGYFWIDEYKLTDEFVCEDTIVWNCTDVGQSVYIAVVSEDDIANITIVQGEVEDNSIPVYDYENSVKPEKFVFPADVNDLLYVDTFDGVVDGAVLGEDGYYHLNSEDGPILFVDLDDAELGVSLAAVNSFGKLSFVEYVDGVAVSQTVFNNAYMEYEACADDDTALYPLTDDLIIMYSYVGVQNDWYSGNGFVTVGDDEDAWMFACYYVEDLTTLGDDNTGDDNTGDDNTGDDNTGDDNTGDDNTGDNNTGDNNTGDNNTGDNNTSDNTGNNAGNNAGEAPQTGDSTNVILWVAVLGLGVVAAVAGMKRKNA